MTASVPQDVAFHFNAVDKLQYACRLLKKAHGTGATLHVLADGEMAARLDAELWLRPPGDFLPHCRDDSPAPVRDRTPIVIGPAVMSAPVAAQVLINLSADLPAPEHMGRYQRIIEVVSTSLHDREMARDRWRWYRQAGIEPLRHDLGPSASRPDA